MTAGTPLPVRVRPRHGETAASYIRRLARANHLRPSYLHALVRTPAYLGTIRADLLAALSGRPAEALERTLAGLNRQPGTGPPHLARPRRPAAAETDPATAEAIRSAGADTTIPVRQLAARHQVPRPAVLRALTPPTPQDECPSPSWPGPAPAQLLGIIAAWLTGEPRLSRTRIWERLVDEHDAEFTCAYLNAYLNRHRARFNGTAAPETGPPPDPQPHPGQQPLPNEKARPGQTQ